MILALGVVGFIILVSFLIFSIDWGGSRGSILDPTQSSITDYADSDVKVRMSIRGAIKSDQEHQQLVITVGNDQTVGELINGFQGNVVRIEQTPGNSDSFRSFLSALHNADFTKEKLPDPRVQYDGACANRLRYTFEFIGSDENTPKSLWATSCRRSDGSFDGKLDDIVKLFNEQLPREQYKALRTGTEF